MKIEVLYPEICNLYGDLGNIRYLQKSRPELEVVETDLKSRPAFLDGGVDLVYVGSATERGLQLLVEALTPYLDEIEWVILMLVQPGFAGAKLIDGILDKVAAARRFLDEHGHPETEISVDGSVSCERARLMRDMGASIFVGGTAGIYRKGMTLDESIPLFRQAIK